MQLQRLALNGAYVRFGSLADICSATGHVRFTPNGDRKSGHPQNAMSALPLKADVCGANRHVRFGPKADIAPRRYRAATLALADRLQLVTFAQATGTTLLITTVVATVVARIVATVVAITTVVARIVATVVATTIGPPRRHPSPPIRHVGFGLILA